MSGLVRSVRSDLFWSVQVRSVRSGHQVRSVISGQVGQVRLGKFKSGQSGQLGPVGSGQVGHRRSG